MKYHARTSKFDPMVEAVELLDVNPMYAHVRHKSGRESTVSLRDLAPPGTIVYHNGESNGTNEDLCPQTNSQIQGSVDSNDASTTGHNLYDIPTPNQIDTCSDTVNISLPDQPQPRRSQRIRHAPKRFDLEES